MDSGIQYIRYVDDILLFAESQVGAQKAAVFLEECSQSLGLIPHGAKFGIRQIGSVKELRNRLPSLADPLRSGSTLDDGGIDQAAADKIFVSGLEGKPLRIADKSRIRYALYRSGKSEEVLRRVLLLLLRHPEEIDGFVAFLANYERSTRIERAAVEILESGLPYDYVRGECWHILARMGSRRTLERLVGLARIDLRERSSIGLRWGVFSFLLACQRERIARCTGRITSQDPLVKALLVPLLPESEYLKGGAVGKLLRDDSFEPGLVLAEQLALRHLSHRDFGLRTKDLKPQVQHAFRAAGLLKSAPSTRVDQIGDLLHNRFRISSSLVWSHIFGTEGSATIFL